MCSAGTALLLLWVISCVGWETAAAAAASSSWGAGAGVPQQGLPLQQQTHHGHVALVQQQQPWWSHTSKQQAALRHTAAKAGAADASLLFQQQQQQQQHQQQKHHHRHRRQLLQLLTEPEAVTSSPVYSEWLEKSQQYSKRYAQGSCFADYPGFIAKDITDFVRLIKDPAATHIELKGNIVFTPEFFPPANANDKSKGINVTHRVNIRACTSVQEPIIIDISNLAQQIYVYGTMTWQGSIRFINSFPSPRRAGLFPLISILSVEGDGVIAFNGLQIHGNEPSPLFRQNDPFWDVYQNDSAFAPQPSMYTRVNDDALVMHNWTFNKTAWVLRSQGTRGVVRPEGDAVWVWRDVLISWSPGPPSGSGLQGTALALAVALPVVFGVLLIGGAVLAWWCCRRRSRPRMAAVGADDKSGFVKDPSGTLKPADSTTGPMSPSYTSTGVLQPSSYTISSTAECVRRDVSNASMATTHGLIEQARRRMQETTSTTREAGIVLDSLLGEGTFGKVYAATWKGSQVAVKTMLLPAAMSGKERREKMAIMETAISSSLSHPNIVQTYTYEVKPLTGELARKALEPRSSTTAPDGTGSAFTFLDDTASNCDNHGWELRLVLEMCDVGNLKDFLGRGGFRLADGQHDMVAIVATALDIARAMHHLHTENIIHSDLKARNVLLKSAGGDARGFVSKVSDFGLSMRIDPTETHVSNFYQGTLTHMAPEVLMYGKLSFASDVYAFGIILWEMYTAMQAFKGVPRALLGHEVTKLGRRPEFPPNCPFDYQLLACRCWESDPAIRPTFQQILEDLERMKLKLQVRSPDSASSLPTHAMLAAGGRPPSSSGKLGGAGSMEVPAGAAAATQLPVVGALAGVGAAAAAAGAAGGMLASRQLASPDSADAAKYHNWEPQTSLLELGSTIGGSTSQQHLVAAQQSRQQQQAQAAAVADAAAAAGDGGGDGGQGSNPPSSGQLGNVSLGTWDPPSGGGFWLSGSLAPESLPGDVQLAALPQQGQAGMQPAAAAVGFQQQQQHHQYPPPHPQQQQQQQQQQHAHLQYGLQQQLNGQGQHQQHLAASGAGAGVAAGGAGDGSSTGVYYQDRSSTMLDGNTGVNDGQPPQPS